MGSDFLALSALADELNSALSGARIDKIVQPEADEIRLFLRAGGRNECLVASCNAGAPRLHLTSERKSKPRHRPGILHVAAQISFGERAGRDRDVAW